MVKQYYTYIFIQTFSGFTLSPHQEIQLKYNQSKYKFLEVLNNQHKNISYTIEKSKNTLQVLDVAVQINDKGEDTWVWQKPAITGLFLNFKAVCPLNWKSD